VRRAASAPRVIRGRLAAPPYCQIEWTTLGILSGLSQIGTAVVKMDIETRLIHAHVELYVRPRDEHGAKAVPVVRRGAYEVRLLEPTQDCHDASVFWLELFDHSRGISLDGGNAEDFEAALTIAEELVSHAEQLNKKCA